MAEPVPSLAAGAISYIRQGDRDVLLIPVEAYGAVRLVRGSNC
ncbi:hypothetical protein ABC974_27915 [Sphingomonas oligophenolica]|uniref:Uncharacterized protein n=1 Tax=Sphingomonas oligophenolica TaxID=301154 RepID=A0ABU9YCF1_9SPHN